MINTTDSLPLRNTYDKYASTNPVERRLMAGFLYPLDAALAPLEPSSVLEVGASVVTPMLR